MSSISPILYNNRNEKVILEHLAIDPTFIEYAQCPNGFIQLVYAARKQIAEMPEFQETRKLIMKQELLSPFKKADDPISDLNTIIEYGKQGLFNRCTEDLLKDSEYMEYLDKRNIGEKQVREMKLGSTKNLIWEQRVNLGASVHPAMWKRYGVRECDGIMCPIEFKDSYIGTFIRIRSIPDMKYSSSLPNVLVHGLYDEEVWSKDRVYLVEGFFDKEALKSIDITNILTTSNAIASIIQSAMIIAKCIRTNKTLVLGMDSDRAGLGAQLQLGLMCQMFHVPCKYIMLPEKSKDLAEFIKRDCATKEDFYDCITSDRDKLMTKYMKLKKEAEVEGDLTYDEYLKRRRGITTDFKAGLSNTVENMRI